MSSCPLTSNSVRRACCKSNATDSLEQPPEHVWAAGSVEAESPAVECWFLRLSAPALLFSQYQSRGNVLTHLHLHLTHRKPLASHFIQPKVLCVPACVPASMCVCMCTVWVTYTNDIWSYLLSLPLLSLDISLGLCQGWVGFSAMVVDHASVGEVILGKKHAILSISLQASCTCTSCYLQSPCLHTAHVYMWDLLVLKGVACS